MILSDVFYGENLLIFMQIIQTKIYKIKTLQLVFIAPLIYFLRNFLQRLITKINVVPYQKDVNSPNFSAVILFAGEVPV